MTYDDSPEFTKKLFKMETRFSKNKLLLLILYRKKNDFDAYKLKQPWMLFLEGWWIGKRFDAHEVYFLVISYNFFFLLHVMRRQSEDNAADGEEATNI